MGIRICELRVRLSLVRQVRVLTTIRLHETILVLTDLDDQPYVTLFHTQVSFMKMMFINTSELVNSRKMTQFLWS